MRARRAVALAAALALACPGAAGASQALTRTYQVGEQVPASIEVAGVEYALSSASSDGAPAPAGASAARERSVAASEYNGDASSYFPASVTVTEDGATYELALSSAEASVSEEDASERTYEQTIVYSALFPDEVAAIPDERAEQVDGAGELTFKKGAVELSDAGDGTGRQSAKVTYTATARESAPKTYKLTARYEPAQGASGTITAVYEPKPAQAAQAQQQPSAESSGEIGYIEHQDDEAADEARSGSAGYALPVAAGAALAVAGAAMLALGGRAARPKAAAQDGERPTSADEPSAKAGR